MCVRTNVARHEELTADIYLFSISNSYFNQNPPCEMDRGALLPRL